MKWSIKHKTNAVHCQFDELMTLIWSWWISQMISLSIDSHGNECEMVFVLMEIKWCKWPVYCKLFFLLSLMLCARLWTFDWLMCLNWLSSCNLQVSNGRKNDTDEHTHREVFVSKNWIMFFFGLNKFRYNIIDLKMDFPTRISPASSLWITMV